MIRHFFIKMMLKPWAGATQLSADEKTILRENEDLYRQSTEKIKTHSDGPVLETLTDDVTRLKALEERGKQTRTWQVCEAYARFSRLSDDFVQLTGSPAPGISADPRLAALSEQGEHLYDNLGNQLGQTPRDPLQLIAKYRKQMEDLLAQAKELKKG